MPGKTEIPDQPLTKHGWPTSLPRACESFRCFIDDANGNRLITGAWEGQYNWRLFVADFAPKLALAGSLGFIASTVPSDYHHRGGLKAWYGDENHPTLHWHWRAGAWSVSESALQAFSEKTGWPVLLLQWPRDLEGCPVRKLTP